MKSYQLHRIGNIVGLMFMILILSIAFIDQLVFGDLPCPTCLLQRTAFVGVGLCFCMNLKFGIRTSHYGLMLLTSLLGLLLALRQIAYHTAPYDSGYGLLFLGLHFYVWAAISFGLVIGLIGVGLLIETPFSAQQVCMGKFTRYICYLFLILVLCNGLSTITECGINPCPDNPTHYHLLG